MCAGGGDGGRAAQLPWKSASVSYNSEHATTIRPSDGTPGYASGDTETHIHSEIYTWISIAALWELARSLRGIPFYIFTTVMCAVVSNWSGDHEQNIKMR